MSSANSLSQKCDVCGKQATHACWDLMQHEVPGDTFVRFSPVGRVKWGCDDHRPVSEEFVTSLPSGSGKLPT